MTVRLLPDDAPPHPATVIWLVMAVRENSTWRSRLAVIRWWLNLWRDDLWSAAVMRVSDRIKSPAWHVVWLMMSGPPWRERLVMTRAGSLVWLVKSALEGPSYTTKHWKANQPAGDEPPAG